MILNVLLNSSVTSPCCLSHKSVSPHKEVIVQFNFLLIEGSWFDWLNHWFSHAISREFCVEVNRTLAYNQWIEFKSDMQISSCWTEQHPSWLFVRMRWRLFGVHGDFKLTDNCGLSEASKSLSPLMITRINTTAMTTADECCGCLKHMSLVCFKCTLATMMADGILLL